MDITRTSRIAKAAAVAGSLALLATGCGGNNNATSEQPASPDNPITLTVTTFGTMGLDDLYTKYESENPGVKIQATNIDTGGNALTDWKTKQAAGAGLPDVQAVEEGWLGQVMTVSDSFTDLRDYGAGDIAGQWVDWKVQQATDDEGRTIGYGTDIGPMGLCYNADLFKEAGLPSERDAVAELFGGDNATWEQFVDVGKGLREGLGQGLLRPVRLRMEFHGQPARRGLLQGRRNLEHRGQHAAARALGPAG